jgi:hypothetical protein
MDHYGLLLSPPALDRLTPPPGLELARLADLPADVLTEAQRVATSLAETEARDKAQSQTTKIAIRRKALLRVQLPLSGPIQLRLSTHGLFLLHTFFG